MKQVHDAAVSQLDSLGGIRISLAVLVLANLLPLVLVSAGAWDLVDVVYFYWSETLVVGFYNLLRIVTVPHVPFRARFALGLFFSAHYGGFCFIAMLFLAEIFGFPGVRPGPPVPGSGFSGFWWPLLPLLVSHGYSFVVHYVLGGERFDTNEGVLMFRPYGRIFAMQIWIALGGYLIKDMNAPMAALLVLVLLKTVTDAGTHAYLHQSRRRDSSRPGDGTIKREATEKTS